MGALGHGDTHHCLIFRSNKWGTTRLHTPSRGIKQGDPLSPYLFLLCAEGLSAMLRKAEESHQLRGIKSSRQGVCISHLLFADDSLLFCRATVEECQRLLDLLEIYKAASGQAINRQKTSLFFQHKYQARGEKSNSTIVRGKNYVKHREILGSTDCKWKI